MLKVYVVHAVLWWTIALVHDVYSHLVPTWILYHSDLSSFMMIVSPLLALNFTIKALRIRKERKNGATGRCD